MARKHDLRVQRANTVINTISKAQEKALDQAVLEIRERLKLKWPALRLRHQKQWNLAEVVQKLRKQFPGIDFHYSFATSCMRPDGGILSIEAKDGEAFPIFIAEKKNQGTNDLRLSEGKTKQAKGNAIERLGKNVIGFRTALKGEAIFPFVCFGDGCDFADDSSILDRVVTIAMFGELNRVHLHKQGPQGEFDRGSFFFREEPWSADEMRAIGEEIAVSSVDYYFSKYGKQRFI